MFGTAFPSKKSKATSMNEVLKRRSKDSAFISPRAARHQPGKSSMSISNAKKSLYNFSKGGVIKTPKVTGSRSRKRKERVDDSISDSLADKIQTA